MYTFTTEMPESTSSPDVAWRIAEYVRVLNASHVLECATAPVRASYGDFVFVHKYLYASDKPGKVYTRITRATENQTFVHCFVENATGKALKSAGWASPAKDKDGPAYRYDLMDEESRLDLYGKGTNASFYK